LDNSHSQIPVGTLRPVAFRPTLKDGLAFSENNTLISNQGSLVKRYLKDVLKSETD
jgi:hypothetical protein